MPETEREARWRRTEAFRRDRFGMFIHWGLYAVSGRDAWLKSTERLTTQAYQRYFDEFSPDQCEMRSWARAARAAGMRYAVMTAKHHDGFCLFDSALSEYKSTRTRAGRDLVREYLDAFRAEGLRVGLYYSLIDWHHPDYPHFGDLYHPQRDDQGARDVKRELPRYLDYLHGQVRELCTNYGALDILWFDFSYPGMTGAAWRAEELVRTVRKLQPGVIIDNRLNLHTMPNAIRSASPDVTAGDFASPEQIIPPAGVTDVEGRDVPWEACMTMNNHWGYTPADRSWKTPKGIIRKLVECVAKNGNLLLNVGPDARGRIPARSLEILAEIGAWMRANGASIHGCGSAGRPKPDWGWYTAGQGKLYAHVFDGNFGALPLAGLAGKVAAVRLLSDGSEVRQVQCWNTEAYQDHAFVNFGPVDSDTYPLPDDIDTVLELDVRE